MSNEISLEIYTFQVRKKGIKNSYQKLEKYDSKNDFLKLAYDYFKNHSKALLGNEKLQKKVQVKSNSYKIDLEKRNVYGIIECGDYGMSSEILDKDGNVKYKKRLLTAICVPSIIYFICPKIKIWGLSLSSVLAFMGYTKFSLPTLKNSLISTMRTIRWSLIS